jgi:hypothetical protein
VTEPGNDTDAIIIGGGPSGSALGTLLVRTLQGNPYLPDTQQRAGVLLAAMNETYDRVLQDPNNLLRPWIMDPQKDHSLTCPTCLGVADYVPEEAAFLCRKYGASTKVPQAPVSIGRSR